MTVNACTLAKLGLFSSHRLSAEVAEKEFDTDPVRYDTLRLYMRLCSIRGICDRLGEGSELYRYCFMVDTDVLTSV